MSKIITLNDFKGTDIEKSFYSDDLEKAVPIGTVNKHGKIKTADGWVYQKKGKTGGIEDKINNLPSIGVKHGTQSILVEHIINKSSADDFEHLNKRLEAKRIERSSGSTIRDITSETLWRKLALRQSIQIEKLESIQDTVGREVLLDKSKETREDQANQEPIRVVKSENKYFLINGTHRVVLAKLREADTVDVEIFNLD